MKSLTLLRHAKSGWSDPAARDFDRSLNDKGQRAAVLVGRHLRTLGLAYDHIIASPAVRVQETLDHFATGYGETMAPIWDRRVYLASAATLLELVREMPEAAGRALLVGHNSGLEDLVLLLVPDRPENVLRDTVETKFPTASLAEIELPIKNWRELAVGNGSLRRFIRPRDLDPTLGPDQD